MCVRIRGRVAKSARMMKIGVCARVVLNSSSSSMKIWSFQILIRFTSFVINKERAGTPSTPLTRPSW